MYSSLASTAPASIAAVANGNAIVVNGLTRGLMVYGGTTVHPLGITAGPTFAATTAASPQYYYVDSVQVLAGGENYRSPPGVTISGVTGAKAIMLGDEVDSVTITSSATTHTAAPAVSFDSSAQANNASLRAILKGKVTAVNVRASTAYYTSRPTVTFGTIANVTTVRAAEGMGVLAWASAAATSGRLVGVVLTDPGIYTWEGSSIAAGTFPVTASRPTGAGYVNGAAELTVDSGAVISSVTFTAGTNYAAAPTPSFTPSGPTKRGGGAVALVDLNNTTSISAVTLISGGADGLLSTTANSRISQLIGVGRLLEPYQCGSPWLSSWRRRWVMDQRQWRWRWCRSLTCGWLCSNGPWRCSWACQ